MTTALVPTTNSVVTIAPLMEALALAIEAGDIKQMKEVHALSSALRKGAQARGMGLDAENQAAEVVIRAERAMGQLLLSLREAGAFGKGIMAGKSFAGSPSVKKGERRSVESPGDDVYTLDNMGITRTASVNFQQIAAIPDDRFERMMAELHALKQRIAKVNFYAAPRKPKDVTEYETNVAAEVPTEPAYAKFREGVYGLVGWTVEEDGTAHVGENALLRMPLDDLSELATLVRMIADAYKAAREARA